MMTKSPFYNHDNLTHFNESELDRRLSTNGVQLEIGPFTVNVSLKFKNIREEFIKIYREYPYYDKPVVWDNYLKIYGRNFYRTFIKPQAFVDGGMPDDFTPFPASMGMVSLEMGLNWQVAAAVKQYLMFHAGVVAKNGVGIIMPAASGSGKSTLAAGLSYRGWQLHSDEFGLLDLNSEELVPYPRAVSLKNESIAVMKDWVGETHANALDYFTDEYEGTPKGTICYMRPTIETIRQMHVRTKPNVVILPIFDPASQPEIRPVTKTMAFFRVVMSSANYGDIGASAFRAISNLIDRSAVCEIVYPSLEDAVALVEQFVDENVETGDD